MLLMELNVYGSLFALQIVAPYTPLHSIQFPSFLAFKVLQGSIPKLDSKDGIPPTHILQYETFLGQPVYERPLLDSRTKRFPNLSWPRP